MASLAMMVGGALINALAFSGTNAAFSMLGDHEKAEMTRHNLAVEKFFKAREAYSRERAERLDYINKTIRERKHAEITFSNLELAMQQYYKITGNQLPPLVVDFP